MLRSLVLLLAAFTPGFGYSSGPPDARTGRPGEGTCLDCHSGPPGSADSTELTGLAQGYVPDSLYSLTLGVHFAGQTRWGFELTAVDSGGARAGQFLVLDSVHTRYSNTGPGYLKQTSAGTHQGQAGPANWTFGWRAPAPGNGPVKFYWCANAANNNAATTGDAICRDSLLAVEASAVAGPVPSRPRVSWRYGNPARDRVVIDYTGDAAEPVRIYAASGRLVCAVAPELSDGRLRAVWNGRDRTNALVPAATYFVCLGPDISRVLGIRLVR